MDGYASYKHLFGPVQSRRLGRSLGVDCINPKTCNLDCVYCECGHTTNRTTERKEYVSSSEVTGELGKFLAARPDLDYVTFGGSGEPTLNSKLGEMVRFVKREFPGYKTALLTNGVLLYVPEVQEALMAFDCILPSLDAVSEKVFKAVNRPDPSLEAGRIIEGILAFSKRYTGLFWVEVFIIPGVNDSADELIKFKENLSRIRLTRVQLNSLDRPGAMENVPAASMERLSEIAQFLLPLPVEIISRSAPLPSAAASATEETLLSSLRRRPMTIEEIAVMMGITINKSAAVLARLSSEGKVTLREANGRPFYFPNRQ
jgi:wyosine [tRNA(Phe)-imidazoG37] synthetase (radical SAM superfamily)